MGVGSRIKIVLKENKMTIKALADKTGIPPNTLYSITKRDEQNVRSDILEKIARALNMDIDYLLTGEGVIYVGPVTLSASFEGAVHRPKASITADLEKLNQTGVREAAKRVHELTQIDEYKKEV